MSNLLLINILIFVAPQQASQAISARVLSSGSDLHRQASPRGASLIQRGSARVSSSTVANASIRSTTQARRSLAHASTVVQQHSGNQAVLPSLPHVFGAPKQPELSGHFLTKSELGPIETVACLEAKQKNPAIQCSDLLTPASLGPNWSGKLNAGNFPSYKDPVCKSDGEYFCDPEGVLTAEERKSVTAELQRLRESTPVTCGQLSDSQKGTKERHFQPFYLGVAVVKEWSKPQSDPEYLQQLGRILSAQWNMNELFTGPVQPYLRCPNTGMLIILAHNRQAYLSTDSCEFICSAKGGPEVVTRTLISLGKGEGAGSAAVAGIQQVYHYLGSVPESSSQVVQSPSEEVNGSSSMNLVQRLVFFGAFGMLIFSMFVAAFVFWFAPGKVVGKQGLGMGFRK